MSYPDETKRQFIELRVEGLSFGKISEQLRIPKSTLHRWADEHADEILRSRRTEWEDLEATGHWRAEDLLLDLNSNLDRLDEHLRRFPIQHLTVRDTLMIIREKSRERDRLRALLMGTGRPCRTATKTERFFQNGTTQPRNTNDLQQSQPDSFDFRTSGAAHSVES
jgi:transposase-like protein